MQDPIRSHHQGLSGDGVEAAVEKVEDIARILEFDILATPGLAIDGKVKAAGRIPHLDEVKRFILDAKGD